MNSKNAAFTIKVWLKNKLQAVEVKTKETTDGVSYFVCYLNGKEITQVRKELYGKWEQLWGKLDAAALESIGHEIEKETLV